ncbi:hypothetical protein EDB86DRAFT_3068012 [Lactarius hatsudake]|nr:hypothetical protein EDB86DRAFT_3068012 [Lactarius hatsudake]
MTQPYDRFARREVVDPPSSLSLHKIPCRSPGCSRWFCNNAGLTKHMRSKHRIPPLQARPIPTPWPIEDLDPQPINNPQPIDNDWPNSPPPDFNIPNGGVSEGPEWEFHPYLCATPCDENHVYLPPGTLPTPPPVQDPDDWTPYRDCVEFELAEFLYQKVQMSGNDINVLSQLWCASLINHGVPPDKINLFDSRDSLYVTIDAMPFRDAVWQGFSLSYNGPRPDDTPEWMTTTYDVWHRDVRQLLHNMLANPDFDDEFDYRQDYSVCGDGHNEYYPVYMSIGNVRNNVRRAHRNAVVLLGFLAIPKTNKRHTDDDEFRKFRRQLFHSSLAQMLSSVRPAMSTPEVTRTPDSHFRRVIYSIGPYIADSPEQSLLACTVGGWCPRCTARLHTGDPSIIGEWQSQELTNALINALDERSLWFQYWYCWICDEFPRADIYELVAPDILHQVIKGTFKDHLVTWVGEYLDLTYGKTYAKTILDDIDLPRSPTHSFLFRIALAPPFPGLRRFPQGRGFKQWTGDDSKALMKVYLPALEGHLPADVIRAFRAFLDFCYLVRRDMFNEDTLGLVQDALDRFHHFRLIFQAIGVRPNGFALPRQHSLCHYRHLIRLFGAPNGLCSSITESKHIKAVKEPWRRSNRCNALGQMLVINQRLDKLAASRSYFESKGMIKSTVTDTPTGALDANPASRSANADQGDNEGNLHHGAESTDPHEMDETHPVDDKDAVSHVFLPESRRIFRQPDLQTLIRRFLFDQLHLDNPNAPAGSDVPLSQCPPFDSKVYVYHTATAIFYSPSDPSGIRGMRSECIRCNPRWRKRTPRFDTAFVKRDPRLPGVRGYDVVRLRALFSFVWEDKYYPCALIRWFVHVGDVPDEVTGLWVVQPDTNADGSPAVDVIHLDSVLRAAHLLPVFGNSFIPIDLSPHESLDAFDTYYINKYIDYHAFEFAS